MESRMLYNHPSVSRLGNARFHAVKELVFERKEAIEIPEVTPSKSNSRFTTVWA